LDIATLGVQFQTVQEQIIILLLLLSNKLFKKLSQKLLAVRKHETNKKRCQLDDGKFELANGVCEELNRLGWHG
jgi:hypothetical protein